MSSDIRNVENTSNVDDNTTAKNRIGTPTHGEQKGSTRKEENATSNGDDDKVMKNTTSAQQEVTSYAQRVLNTDEVEEVMKKCQLTLGKETRIALVGKTGVGKSSTANQICGIPNKFKSAFKFKSVTKICQIAQVEVDGRPLVLIDTPGIFDSGLTEDVQNEIQRCVHLGAPGLNAILFVMRLRRFTDEDHKTIEVFFNFFNKDLLRFAIIVFTHGDELEDMDIDEFLDDAPKKLKDFLGKCGNRKVVFNNKLEDSKSKDQVSKLLNMIEDLKKETKFKFYSDALFDYAEKKIREYEEIKIKECFLKEDIEDYKKKLKEEIRQQIRNEIREEMAQKNSRCTIL